MQIGGIMAFSEALAERIRQGLARRKNVEDKKMFGGVGFLLHGNLLVGVWKDSLIVRLGPDEGEAALREPHVREFDITGRPMKVGASASAGEKSGAARDRGRNPHLKASSRQFPPQLR
jgi:hypothetical protein